MAQRGGKAPRGEDARVEKASLPSPRIPDDTSAVKQHVGHRRSESQSVQSVQQEAEAGVKNGSPSAVSSPVEEELRSFTHDWKKERARRRHKELMARQALKPVPVVPQPSEWAPPRAKYLAIRLPMQEAFGDRFVEWIEQKKGGLEKFHREVKNGEVTFEFTMTPYQFLLTGALGHESIMHSMQDLHAHFRRFIRELCEKRDIASGFTKKKDLIWQFFYVTEQGQIMIPKHLLPENVPFELEDPAEPPSPPSPEPPPTPSEHEAEEEPGHSPGNHTPTEMVSDVEVHQERPHPPQRPPVQEVTLLPSADPRCEAPSFYHEEDDERLTGDYTPTATEMAEEEEEEVEVSRECPEVRGLEQQLFDEMGGTEKVLRYLSWRCPGLQFQIIPTYDEPGPAPWQLWAYGQRHAVSEETLQDAEKLFEDLITAMKDLCQAHEKDLKAKVPKEKAKKTAIRREVDKAPEKGQKLPVRDDAAQAQSKKIVQAPEKDEKDVKAEVPKEKAKKTVIREVDKAPEKENQKLPVRDDVAQAQSKNIVQAPAKDAKAEVPKEKAKKTVIREADKAPEKDAKAEFPKEKAKKTVIREVDKAPEKDAKAEVPKEKAKKTVIREVDKAPEKENQKLPVRDDVAQAQSKNIVQAQSAKVERAKKSMQATVSKAQEKVTAALEVSKVKDKSNRRGDEVDLRKFTSGFADEEQEVEEEEEEEKDEKEVVEEDEEQEVEEKEVKEKDEGDSQEGDKVQEQEEVEEELKDSEEEGEEAEEEDAKEQDSAETDERLKENSETEDVASKTREKEKDPSQNRRKQRDTAAVSAAEVESSKRRNNRKKEKKEKRGKSRRRHKSKWSRSRRRRRKRQKDEDARGRHQKLEEADEDASSTQAHRLRRRKASGKMEHFREVRSKQMRPMEVPKQSGESGRLRGKVLLLPRRPEREDKEAREPSEREEKEARERVKEREEKQARELAKEREEKEARARAKEREEQKGRELAKEREEKEARELAKEREEQEARELVKEREEQEARELAREREEKEARELAKEREEKEARELAKEREEQKGIELAKQRELQEARELAKEREEKESRERAKLKAVEEEELREKQAHKQEEHEEAEEAKETVERAEREKRREDGAHEATAAARNIQEREEAKETEAKEAQQKEEALMHEAEEVATTTKAQEREKAMEDKDMEEGKQVTPGRLRSPSTARLRVFDQDGARELPGETFTDSVLLGSDPSRCGVLALGSGVAKEHVRVVYQPNKGGFSLHPLSGQTIQCAVSAYPKLLEALRSEAKRLPLPSQKRREVLQRLQDIEDQQRGSMLCNPIDGRKRLTPLFSAFTVGRAEPRERIYFLDLIFDEYSVQDVDPELVKEEEARRQAAEAKMRVQEEREARMSMQAISKAKKRQEEAGEVLKREEEQVQRKQAEEEKAQQLQREEALKQQAQEEAEEARKQLAEKPEEARLHQVEEEATEAKAKRAKREAEEAEEAEVYRQEEVPQKGEGEAEAQEKEEVMSTSEEASLPGEEFPQLVMPDFDAVDKPPEALKQEEEESKVWEEKQEKKTKDEKTEVAKAELINAKVERREDWDSWAHEDWDEQHEATQKDEKAEVAEGKVADTKVERGEDWDLWEREDDEMKPIDPKAEEQISPVSELSDEEQEHVSPVTDDESGKVIAKPKAMPRAFAQAPEHEHASDVPQWVKEHENACYAAYAKQPPAFHRPRAEAWRWRARRDFVMPAVVAPFGRPELECFKDRKLAMATRRILEVARQLADSEKMTWQQKKKRRKRLLPVEVPGKVYQLFKQAFNTYKQMQPWMSDTMKLMLMREIICSVLYVEDQFSDPLFWRKVAKPLQVIGVVVHLTIPELPRAKAAEGTREPSPRKDVKGRQRRSRPIEEDLGPPYYATYEVDAVEFSQDSIAKRFTCGRFLEDTVDDLFTGKVEHLNTKAFPFMLLLAVKVGDRIISRCNRRLWALRELQRLKRKKDPDAIVDVKVKVRDILNETVKAVVEARAPAPILSARLRDGLKDEEDIQDDGFEALFQHADAPDRTEDVADRTEGGSGRPRKRQRIAPGED